MLLCVCSLVNVINYKHINDALLEVLKNQIMQILAFTLVFLKLQYLWPNIYEKIWSQLSALSQHKNIDIGQFSKTLDYFQLCTM